MASMARVTGISHSVVYRLFSEDVDVPYRAHHLPRVMSIDEFRATSDEGTFAFHIVDPVNGKVIDILSDRTQRTLKDYFKRFGFAQRKKVKFIIMDLSGPFHNAMRHLFPKAMIIVDRFHIVKILRENMTRA